LIAFEESLAFRVVFKNMPRRITKKDIAPRKHQVNNFY
jgi:hypothetical protein